MSSLYMNIYYDINKGLKRILEIFKCPFFQKKSFLDTG